MQKTDTYPASDGRTGEQRRYYRVERQFSAGRRPEEWARDLLRAHWGE